MWGEQPDNAPDPKFAYGDSVLLDEKEEHVVAGVGWFKDPSTTYCHHYLLKDASGDYVLTAVDTGKYFPERRLTISSAPSKLRNVK